MKTSPISPSRIFCTASRPMAERCCVPCCTMRLYFCAAATICRASNISCARLLDVDVLAGLAAPDGLQRVVVVGRGDGNGVDGLVFKQLAQVGVSRRTLPLRFLNVTHTGVEDGLVNVADSCYFDIGHLTVGAYVAAAEAVHPHASYSDCVVRAGESM